MIYYHEFKDDNGEPYIETDPYCLPAINADYDFNQEVDCPSIEEYLDLDSDSCPKDYEYPDYEPGTAYTRDCY